MAVAFQGSSTEGIFCMIIYYSGIGVFKLPDGTVLRPETILKDHANIMMSFAAKKTTKDWLKKIIKVRKTK